MKFALEQTDADSPRINDPAKQTHLVSLLGQGRMSHHSRLSDRQREKYQFYVGLAGWVVEGG